MAGHSNVLPFARATGKTAPSIIPSRLRDARKAARLSQAELGGLAGVTRQAISAYERGNKTPEPETFKRLSQALEQPIAFFTNEDSPTFGEYGPRFFRKFGPDTNRRNEACSVLGGWFVQTARYLEQFVNYPAVSVPEAAPAEPGGRYSQEEIDAAAELCRATWGLGLGPISNVLALLEAKGVAVCRCELEGEQVEAFSFWNGDRPFIFMASEKEAGVRTRYDLAHELGHLVLHRWVDDAELADPKALRIIETEADKFAAAFLLPHRSFPDEVYTTKLDAFVNLKRRWLVSIQAMIYRCRDLSLIDEDQFMNLYKQISFRRWRKREPLDDPSVIPIEQPRLLRRAAELLLSSGRKHPDEIMAELPLSPRLIEAFCNVTPGALARGNTAVFEPTLK